MKAKPGTHVSHGSRRDDPTAAHNKADSHAKQTAQVPARAKHDAYPEKTFRGHAGGLGAVSATGGRKGPHAPGLAHSTARGMGKASGKSVVIESMFRKMHHKQPGHPA